MYERDAKIMLQITPSKAWMLKFLRGNASILNASVPTGVASDNRTVFSPALSPRNRHGAAKIKETKIRPKQQKQHWKQHLVMSASTKLAVKM